MKSLILEFNDQLGNKVSQMEKSFELIKRLIDQLKPRNEIETNAIRSVISNLQVIRSGIKGIVSSANQIQPQDLANDDRINSTGSPQIEEMASAAGGAAMGVATAKKKKNKLMVEEDAIKEAKENIRNLIRESLEELYSTNPNFIFEENGNNDNTSKSTGEAVLERIFGELREAISRQYPELRTSKTERESYKQHLMKMFSGYLSQMGKQGVNIPGSSENSSKVDIKSPEFKAQYLMTNIPSAENPSVEEITQGFNFAAETFNLTFAKVKEAADSLANPKDKQIFIDGIIQNIPAVCDLLEQNLSSDPTQNMNPSQDEMNPELEQNPIDPQIQPKQSTNNQIAPPNKQGNIKPTQNDSLNSILNQK